MILHMVDTETTGLDGGPSDLVLDIGIVEIDTGMKTVAPVYSEVVGYDVSGWSDRLRDSWIFSHSDLTPEMVSRGKPLEEVVGEVRGLLDGKTAVSYNEAFDFGKFLYRHPWSLRCDTAPDPMLIAHELVDGDIVFDDGSTSWPRLEKAYRVLCPGDPAGMGGPQAHRALSDALQASYVLLRLVDEGLYPEVKE